MGYGVAKAQHAVYAETTIPTTLRTGRFRQPSARYRRLSESVSAKGAHSDRIAR
jgi:hypothetical protein